MNRFIFLLGSIMLLTFIPNSIAIAQSNDLTTSPQTVEFQNEQRNLEEKEEYPIQEELSPIDFFPMALQLIFPVMMLWGILHLINSGVRKRHQQGINAAEQNTKAITMNNQLIEESIELQKQIKTLLERKIMEGDR